MEAGIGETQCCLGYK